MNQFVNALEPNSEAFEYLMKLFPKISGARVNASIFFEPQIKQLMLSEDFMFVNNEPGGV